MIPDRRFTRIAVAAALVAALGLAGCGRKGPLDAPPAARVSQGQGTPAEPEVLQDAQGNPVAPRGQQRPFMLDWLLN